MSLKSLRRSSLPALLAVATLVGGAHVANAQEILTESSPSSGGIGYGSSVPVSIGFGFSLSDGPWNLADITVQMYAVLPNLQPATIAGTLWSDNGSGLPGAEIAALDLTGGTVGTSHSPLTFSPTGTVVLTANTQYWFVARTGAPAYIDSRISDSNTGTHGANSGMLARIGDQAFDLFSGIQAAATVRGIRPTGGNGGGGAVPEPSEWAAMGVLGMALGGLALRKRRTA